VIKYVDICQISTGYLCTNSYQWMPYHHGPTWLTESKRHRLSAQEIEYVEELPEYPRTSEGGYAYIVSAGDRTPDQIHSSILSTVSRYPLDIYQISDYFLDPVLLPSSIRR
jgi:hypothetical protein